MTSKFQRPAGAYAGVSGLANRTKYQDDSNAVPKRAISSSKVDGDFNYIIDSLNLLDGASGTRGSIGERLDVSLNPDGTLKAGVTAAYEEWTVHAAAGTLAKVDAATLTLGGGDFRSIYKPNRRVKVTAGGVAVFGDVAACSFAGSLTTLALAGIVDEDGAAADVPASPTQLAYAPQSPGATGSLPRVVDSLGVVADASTYVLTRDDDELVVKRDGEVVVRVDAGGLAGGCVGSAGLSEAVLLKLMPTGAVVPFAGASAPEGWLLCAGQAVSRATYAALFGVVGTVFGAGDGSTTFAVPDLRGRGVFGVDGMGGSAAGRVTTAISGIDGATLGAGGGSEAVQEHTHVAAVTDGGHAHGLAVRGNGTGTGGSPSPAVADSAALIATGSTATATTGITVANDSYGSGGSQNMPPALMLAMIIKA